LKINFGIENYRLSYFNHHVVFQIKAFFTKRKIPRACQSRDRCDINLDVISNRCLSLHYPNYPKR